MKRGKLEKKFYILLKDVFYQPYSENQEGFVDVKIIDKRERKVAKEVLKLLNSDANEIYKLIKKKSYQEIKDEHKIYEVKKMLMVALSFADDNADILLALSLDKKSPWYVRVNAINLLSENKNLVHIEKLKVVLEDKKLEGEIRESALEALAKNNFIEILPLLKKIMNSRELRKDWWDAEISLLIARAYLGDKDILRDMIEMSYSDWHSHRAIEALPLLIQKMGGLDSVITYLLNKEIQGSLEDKLLYLSEKERQESVKRWGIKQLVELNPKNTTILIQKLADSSALVALDSSNQLALLPTIVPLLQEILDNKKTPRNHKIWILKTLLSMKVHISSNTFKNIDNLYVPWEKSIPKSIREAIIYEYGLYGEKNTDVRYSIEAYLQKEYIKYDRYNSVRKLRNKLLKYDFSCGENIDCSDFHQQGEGTYTIMNIDKEQFYISKLGAFVAIAMNVEQNDSFYSYNFNLNNLSKERLEKYEKYKKIAEDEGFMVLEPKILEYIVPHLNVYYFGNREPLSIQNLIFYWQD